jgi:adenosylcobinamide-phosphate synthase
MNFFTHLQPLVPLLSAVLVALLADAVTRLLVPDFRDRLDPLLGVPARMARRLHDKLNRAVRTRADRAGRGFIAFVMIMGVGGVLGIGLGAAAAMHPWAAPLVWFLCLRMGAPWGAGPAALRGGGPEILERFRVPVLVPTRTPDRHAVIRMIMETVATSVHLGGLSAIFWACVAVYAGIDGLAVAVFITTLQEADRVVTTPENAGTPFVQLFEITEKIINFVPARVAALLFVLAAFFVPKGRPGAAFRLMFNQGERHILIDSGWPIAAVSGALHVALPAGRGRNKWIGADDATARATDADLRRALWLHAVVSLLVILIFTAMIFLGLGS